MFDASCLYNINEHENYDINKLFGFSTTYNHQNQSARVGWRCLDGKTLEIVTYSYNNREFRGEKILGRVKPNEKFICTIEDIESHYVYRFEKDGYILSQMDEKKPDKVLFHYLLYPYWGGNTLCPHDMKLYLRKL
jgi:hypothetical protein